MGPSGIPPDPTSKRPPLAVDGFPCAGRQRLLRCSAESCVLFLATLTSLFIPVSASAEDKRFSLRYAASTPCPSESEFVAMVRGYTQRWSLVDEAASADLTIHVRMSSRPSRSRARSQ